MSVGRQLSIVGFMLALAAIDFGAALMAQDFADRRRLSTLLVGSGLSITLFVVYAVALRLANLSIVTMGWIVMLQVAVITFDVVRHGLRLTAVQWAAVSLVIVLQVFLTATTQRNDGGPSPYGPEISVGQTSATTPVRSPVTRNTTLRATETAWSANRS
ncbi:hypothetical protein acdb102_11190 [Acidothermaceae bacterium B102]|nr:hypothetical protein acdb102_11190 [Acidothermaceae bacterium B102]